MAQIESRRSLLTEHFIGQFHPRWFVMTMGTGISAVVLYNFPWEATWLRYCSYPMFACAAVLFVLLNGAFILSCFLYPQNVPALFHDVSKSVFWGCYSMGLSSIISYLHYITGESWVTALFTLWLINVALSIGTSLVVTFLVHFKGHMKPENLHISILLPVVAQNVVATAGGVLYETMHPNLQTFNLIAAFLCWSNGMALTGWVISLYFWKLYTHKIDIGYNEGFAAFIPIGAFGQGAFALLIITDSFRSYLREHNPGFLNSDPYNSMLPAHAVIVGEGVRYIGFFVALFLLSNGFYFTLHAILCLIATKCRGYSSAWWSASFPLGAMALGCREVWKLFDLGAFRVVSVIYSVSLLLVTLASLGGTAIFDFPHQALWRPQKVLSKIDALEGGLSSSNSGASS